MTETTWTYLDVGVVRIQRYLTRTPDLKGLRGASAWLSHTTDRGAMPTWVAQIAECEAAGAVVNVEAGEADGVVPLRLTEESDPWRVAMAVMADLRTSLPAAELQARWYQGTSYVEAYRAGRRGGTTSVPAPGDFPALEDCRQCRADPAVHMIDIHQKRVPVCADCAARYEQRYRRPGLRKGWEPVKAEGHLLGRLSRQPEDTAQHFDELASLGDEESKRNHLATVCADGNAMGELFGRVVASGDTGLKERVSHKVSAATRQALATATARVTGTDRLVPVIPHVVGGDDLVASVVADRAWLFVTSYLRAFSEHLAELAAVNNGVVPSASAGVVFGHATFPFPRAAELAQNLLRQAKKAHAGRRAAVAWLDVTREGETTPRTRMAWPVAALSRYEPAVRDLRTVEASGRAVLERLVDPVRPDLSLARLHTHARRLGREDVLAPFLDREHPAFLTGVDAPPGQDDELAQVARLADALALARWWR